MNTCLCGLRGCERGFNNIDLTFNRPELSHAKQAPLNVAPFGPSLFDLFYGLVAESLITRMRLDQLANRGHREPCSLLSLIIRQHLNGK